MTIIMKAKITDLPQDSAYDEFIGRSFPVVNQTDKFVTVDINGTETDFLQSEVTVYEPIMASISIKKYGYTRIDKEFENDYHLSAYINKVNRSDAKVIGVEIEGDLPPERQVIQTVSRIIAAGVQESGIAVTDAAKRMARSQTTWVQPIIESGDIDRGCEVWAHWVLTDHGSTDDL